MEDFVQDIERSIKGSKVVLEGIEGSCSRKCIVISDTFENTSLLHRHRTVNAILEKYFADKLHALSIKTYTTKEWEHARGN